jgi:hypothetical protein
MSNDSYKNYQSSEFRHEWSSNRMSYGAKVVSFTAPDRIVAIDSRNLPTDIRRTGSFLPTIDFFGAPVKNSQALIEDIFVRMMNAENPVPLAP